MFSELVIRNLGVIDEVTLDLAPGLNVLTGETGAGKTMVVSAIELLRGGRADTERVRAGADTAVVEGRLVPAPAAAADWLEQGDDELVVSREVGGDRSRARLGGRLAPASALADTLGAVVEMHGQSDSARLSTPAVQRELLDRSGGEAVAGAAAAHRDVYERWRACGDQLDALRSDDRDRARELDRLHFELEEIDAVAPEGGEEDALEASLQRLEHAETLTHAAAEAAGAIAADGGARDALGVAVAALRATAGLDEMLDKLTARTEGLAAEAQDLGLELRAYAEALEPDADGLEALRARRAALARLTRKYGPDAQAVAAYAEEARERLIALESSGERLAALQAEEAELAATVAAAAERLTAARRSAGDRLARLVGEHLAELAMASATLEVALEPAALGPHGADRVEFRLSPHAGEVARPLAKAASGGERSRVALAVRLALATADETPVLVFDEVDAGIGGEVARAVGSKLARLARGRQVLCITHLAQLAAHADAHFVVSKSEAGGRTVAGVERLDEGSRLAELARMLSGDPGSAVATEHAAELRAAALAESSQGW